MKKEQNTCENCNMKFPKGDCEIGCENGDCALQFCTHCMKYTSKGEYQCPKCNHIVGS